MTIYSFLSLFSCVIIFILGDFVYHQNKRDRLNIIFTIYCICISCAAFGEFMYRQAESLQVATFWLKIASFWPFNLALLLHFTLLFTGRENLLKRNRNYLLIYLPALLFTILAFLFTEPVKEYWGYTFRRTSVMQVIGNSWGLSYGLLSFFLLLKYYWTIRERKKKQQAKYILIGQLFPNFAPILTEVLLPTLNLKLPESIITSITLFAAFTGYAIWKYELFVINPATTALNVFSTMPDSLILMNPELKILDANPSLLHLLGYQRKELIGAPFALLLGNNEKVKEKIRAELKSQGLIQNFEINYQTKMGESIPIFFTGSIIKDKAGDISGVVGIGSDIRGIKQLQTQLFQSEKLKAVGHLAGGIAHEINNPLGVILGFAQSIAKRINEDDPLYLPIKSIEREALRCKKLIGDLLAFSRAGVSQTEPLDINQTIDVTLSLVETGIKVKHIEINKEYQPDIPQITANRNQIQQVILNILGNAMDSMPRGGKIKIITKPAGDHIEISISDNGSGMTEEVKKHLFEPFFTTKGIGQRTDLGLSLCYQIIRNHHGTITVESEQAQGATFRVKLPINKG
ncbi:MAG TPA: ATP-binding protein [Bacillota bacterium]|nr:ATP-binding protein [Bacillota bacterium]